MRAFVRTELWPLETIMDDLTYDGLDAIVQPLQEAGQAPRDVGRAPAAGARRPGVRAGQARADARDPRHDDDRADGVRQPGARLRQRGDPRRRRARRTRSAGSSSRCSPATLRSAFSMTEPEVAGSDPTQIRTRARPRRRRVRHRRAQVVHLERVAGRLPDRDGRDRPRRAAPPARVDVHRPDRRARREHRARRADDGVPVRAQRRARRARGDRLRGRAHPRPTLLLGDGGRGVHDRPAAAGPGPDPPLHALHRPLAAGVRHAVRAGRPTARATAGCSASIRRSRTGSRTRRRRCTPPGS